MKPPRADSVQQVRPHVLFWEAYAPAVKADLSSAAVRTREGLVLIDPIALTEEALAEVRELGTPRAIVLTNGNHARAAGWYRERWEVPVWAHAGAAAALEEEVTVDGWLQEGEMVGGELQVVELPGAGPGEIALWQPGAQLHCGDAVINLPATGLALLPEKYCTAPKQMRTSLRKLLPLPFSALFMAHGQPLVEHASERLAGLLV